MLDVSGSMARVAPGGSSTLLQGAKGAITQVSRSLPAEVALGLRVYGAEYGGTDTATACADTQLAVPPRPGVRGPGGGGALGADPSRRHPDRPVARGERGRLRRGDGRRVVVLSVTARTTAPRPARTGQGPERIEHRTPRSRWETVGLALGGQPAAVDALRCIAGAPAARRATRPTTRRHGRGAAPDRGADHRAARRGGRPITAGLGRTPPQGPGRRLPRHPPSGRHQVVPVRATSGRPAQVPASVKDPRPPRPLATVATARPGSCASTTRYGEGAATSPTATSGSSRVRYRRHRGGDDRGDRLHRRRDRLPRGRGRSRCRWRGPRSRSVRTTSRQGLPDPDRVCPGTRRNARARRRRKGNDQATERRPPTRRDRLAVRVGVRRRERGRSVRPALACPRPMPMPRRTVTAAASTGRSRPWWCWSARSGCWRCG